MNKYVVHSVRNILLFTESSRVKTHSKLEVSFSGFYTNAGQMTRGTLGDKTRKTDAGRWKTSTKTKQNINLVMGASKSTGFFISSDRAGAHCSSL